MPKVCSKRTCRRLAEGKFKMCQRCRDMKQKSLRKRKKRKDKAAKATARDGYKHCRNCSRDFPLTHFTSSHKRRKALTNKCATCRAVQSKCAVRKTSTSGKCKQVWLDWKNDKSCQLCGYQGDNIEADHRAERGKKIHACSHYAWWACHGGVPALKAELLKTRPICVFCHRLVSQQERGKTKKKTIEKKRAYVNAIKLKIGACQVCKRKLENEEECCAFDFDHIDTKFKQESIGRMVGSYSLKRFFQYIDIELAKCRLICCMCHANHTIHQRREITLEIQELASSL